MPGNGCEVNRLKPAIFIAGFLLWDFLYILLILIIFKEICRVFTDKWRILNKLVNVSKS